MVRFGRGLACRGSCRGWGMRNRELLQRQFELKSGFTKQYDDNPRAPPGPPENVSPPVGIDMSVAAQPSPSPQQLTTTNQPSLRPVGTTTTTSQPTAGVMETAWVLGRNHQTCFAACGTMGPCNVGPMAEIDTFEEIVFVSNLVGRPCTSVAPINFRDYAPLITSAGQCQHRTTAGTRCDANVPLQGLDRICCCSNDASMCPTGPTS